MTLEIDLNQLYNIMIISQDFTADHTLLDVMMLTDLNIFAPDRSYDLLSKKQTLNLILGISEVGKGI